MPEDPAIRARLERFGDLEKAIAKKMVRQFRTFDASRGLLQIEAETLAYIALDYLEEHGRLVADPTGNERER